MFVFSQGNTPDTPHRIIARCFSSLNLPTPASVELEWQEPSLTQSALSSWLIYREYFLKCSCNVASTRVSFSPAQFSIARHVPLHTLQHPGRMLWGRMNLTSSWETKIHARKPLSADEWKCDLAPRIRCLVLLPHCLLYCFWGSQKSCHDTEAILCERGKQGILPDCKALAACLEQHEV